MRRFSSPGLAGSAGVLLTALSLVVPAVGQADRSPGRGNGNPTQPAFGLHRDSGGIDAATGSIQTPPVLAVRTPPVQITATVGGHGAPGPNAPNRVAVPGPGSSAAAGPSIADNGDGGRGDGNGNGHGNGNAPGPVKSGRVARPITSSIVAAPTPAATVTTPPASLAAVVSVAPVASAAPAPPAPAPAPPLVHPATTVVRRSTSRGSRATTTSRPVRRSARARRSSVHAGPAPATPAPGSAQEVVLASHRARVLAGPHGGPFVVPGSGRSRARGLVARRQAPASTPLTRLGGALGSVPGLVGRLVPLPVPDWSKPIIAALLLICVLLALRAWLSGHRAGRLEAQREQLTADLALMQAALIPEIPAELGALGVSAAYRPADGPGAGGDFYDAFALDEHRVAIILGDVSGHGRTALRRAAHMHYTLRAYVEMGLDPRSALKLAGRVLHEDEHDLFTTVVIAVHDAQAGALTYASAGHPAPVLMGPDAGEPLRGSASPPLGWGVATGRRQTTLPFPGGSRACFFTDGVTEARDEAGLLGRSRLEEIVAGLDGELSADALLGEVRRTARVIHDDMAACVITAVARAWGDAHRTEELEVDLGQLADGQGERFLAACGTPAGDIERALAGAASVAAEFGSVMLRVDFTRDGLSATAIRPATLTLEAPARAGGELSPSAA
jgi:hypothetical protein